MDEPLEEPPNIGIVVIGRNEGERLKRCLQSLPPQLPAIYIDSGSTDGSVEFARSIGIEVFELNLDIPFTAARARNVGWRAIAERYSDVRFIQFVDGDCEMHPRWFELAPSVFADNQDLACVFGRLRERHPEHSIYNRMCDDEWNVPLGLVESCGGIALFRLSAISSAGGFCDDLIAGEEPDLCLRLRQTGWAIQRIEPEMALHDAAISTFAAFWRRVQRSGFAYAEHVRRHGKRSIPSWRRQLYGIVAWGLILPTLALTAVTFAFITGSPFAVAVSSGIALIYLLQILRITFKKNAQGADIRFAIFYSATIVSGKVAQAYGMIRCWSAPIRGPNGARLKYDKA